MRAIKVISATATGSITRYEVGKSTTAKINELRKELKIADDQAIASRRMRTWEQCEQEYEMRLAEKWYDC